TLSNASPAGVSTLSTSLWNAGSSSTIRTFSLRARGTSAHAHSTSAAGVGAELSGRRVGIGALAERAQGLDARQLRLARQRSVREAGEQLVERLERDLRVVRPLRLEVSEVVQRE